MENWSSDGVGALMGGENSENDQEEAFVHRERKKWKICIRRIYDRGVISGTGSAGSGF